MAKREKNGMCFFFDWEETFKELPGDACKTLLLDMLDYSKSDTLEEPSLEKYEIGSAKTAARFIFQQIKRRKESVETGRSGGLASSARKGGGKGGSKGSATTKTKTKTITKTKQKQDNTVFELQLQQMPARKKEEKAPPILSAVYRYFKDECGLDDAGSEAEKFVAYNARRDWDCLPDWKKSADLWAARSSDRSAPE